MNADLRFVDAFHSRGLTSCFHMEDAQNTPVETTEEQLVANNDLPFVQKLVNLTSLRAGMTVKVHEKIKDTNARGEERERIQIFEGMILALRGAGITRTMTVRKVSKGFGVEKIYPINSPIIDKIELVKTAKVRRAKLNFVKNVKRRFKRKLKETWL